MGYAYTASEKAQRARLVVKGVRNAYGDTSRIEREIERIDAAAQERWEREQRALYQQLDHAKDDLAAAKAAEKAADRHERQAAKDRRKEAEDRLRRAERALR